MHVYTHACMHACMYTHMHARAWPVCASRGSIALPVTAARSSIPCRGGASAGYGAATNSACPLRREVEAGIALAFSVGVRAARGREKHCTWMRMRGWACGARPTQRGGKRRLSRREDHTPHYLGGRCSGMPRDRLREFQGVWSKQLLEFSGKKDFAPFAANRRISPR